MVEKRFLGSAAALVVGAVLAACSPALGVIPCEQDSNCDLRPGGACLPSPLNNDQCAYPSDGCPGGLAWGELSGDIGGVCVGQGVDAGIDAVAIDAQVAPPPDAVGGITAGMVKIPAGAFWRGCNPANPNPYACDSLQLSRESPYRQLTLSEFWIDKTEVTQEKFATCIAANGCTPPAPVDPQNALYAGYDPANKPDHPVSNVTWAQARSYCMWLGKRFPTEAEWEKAARGTDGRMYPWGDTEPTDTCLLANLGVCTGSGTHAVGSHPSGDSPYGVSDMAGNVAEWVADFYDVTYYASAPAVDPQGPLSGNERVARGGGYPHSNLDGRAASRARSGANAPADYPRGFRCAYAP